MHNDVCGTTLLGIFLGETPQRTSIFASADGSWNDSLSDICKRSCSKPQWAVAKEGPRLERDEGAVLTARNARWCSRKSVHELDTVTHRAYTPTTGEQGEAEPRGPLPPDARYPYDGNLRSKKERQTASAGGEFGAAFGRGTP